MTIVSNIPIQAAPPEPLKNAHAKKTKSFLNLFFSNFITDLQWLRDSGSFSRKTVEFSIFINFFQHKNVPAVFIRSISS